MHTSAIRCGNLKVRCFLKLRRKDGSIREYLQPYAKKKTLEARDSVTAWLEKCNTHENPDYSLRAEKMIWPSEYRSMADAYGAARRRRT